jgi:Zn-finger protein
MPKHSSKFFQNRSCEFYVNCHPELNGAKNCLFCFCPLYHKDNCGGSPVFITTVNGSVKDCSNCQHPHDLGGYEFVIAGLNGVVA